MSDEKGEEQKVKIPVPAEEPVKDQEQAKKDADAAPVRPLDEDDIAVLKKYSAGPYSISIKKIEDDIKELTKRVNVLKGVKESDTGLAPPSLWNLQADKEMMMQEATLQVARCTKVIAPGTADAKYMINIKQMAKYVVGLGQKVSPTDIEDGMRIGVDRSAKMQIQIPLPPKVRPARLVLRSLPPAPVTSLYRIPSALPPRVPPRLASSSSSRSLLLPPTHPPPIHHHESRSTDRPQRHDDDGRGEARCHLQRGRRSAGTDPEGE